MNETGFASGGVFLPLVVVAAGLLSLVVLLRVTAWRGEGFFQYFPYAALLSLAVIVFTSGRSLMSDYDTQFQVLTQRQPLANWTTHVTSALLLFTALERIASYGSRRGRTGSAPLALVIAFLVFWLTTAASPAILGAEPYFNKQLIYALVAGCGALVLSRSESDTAVAAARNALLIFLGAGVALIPVRPALVMASNYSAGLVHGLPRFAGLAPHAVSLGMLAQLALLCLYARPISHRWLNRACWVLGVLCLILAQSKTSWMSFPLCAACIYWLRERPEGVGDVVDSRKRVLAHVVLFGAVLAIVAVGVAYITGNLDQNAGRLFSGQQGADLASLSGRDRVWAAALEEWGRHPVFGYGNNLFDEAYSASIQMPFATHGHNQFIDTLARSGLVGETGLVLYVLTLLLFSVRCAKSSQGLSLAIFVAIALRCVSEVPLTLEFFGPEVLQQVLLLMVLAGHAQRRDASAAPTPDPNRDWVGYRAPQAIFVERSGPARRPTEP